MFDVISIGAATVDILVKSEKLVVSREWIRVARSSKNEIDHAMISSGGGATNSAAGMARLGLKSACVAQVGDDGLRNYVAEDLKKYRVDSGMLVKSKHDGTDFSVILVGKDGSRSILVNRGKDRLEEKDIKWEKIKKTKWFYISSLEGNMDLLEKLIGQAVENKIEVAVNPGSRELRQRNRLIPLLKQVHFLLLNKTEAEELAEVKMEETKFFNRLAGYEAKVVAVTNGRRGAHVLTETNHYYSPIIDVKPVDETGAGDAFGSAMVAGLVYGLSPEKALDWGMKNSASVVRYLGAKAGLLKLQEIRK